MTLERKLPFFANHQDILVVDDLPSLCFLLKDYLQSKGYKVHAATSATDAYDLLASRKFGLVIADLQLNAQPGSNGMDVIGHVRKHSVSTPIIAISGSASPGRLSQLAAVGVYAFLSKPFPLERLHQMILSVMPQPSLS